MKTYNELKNELEGKISALEVAKQDLVLKIRDLNTLVQGESTITDGVYDTYSSPEPKTKGSKEDIQNLRNEIDKISDKIKQLLKEKADLENNKEEIESRIEEKKRSEEERKQLEKEEKIQLFKNVKRSYKSGNLWERFILKVQGESPDWNRIKKYDINELRYLDKASRGDIRLTQESVKNKTERLEKKGASGKEISKETKKIKWNHFIKQLQSKENVDLGIKTEGGYIR